MPEHVRIAAVADVYDALTSDRPYHRRRGVIDALAEMAAGAQGFDVAAFNALLDITLKDRRVVRNFCKTRMNPKIATRLLANR